jgi:hypothetical protein
MTKIALPVIEDASIHLIFNVLETLSTAWLKDGYRFAYVSCVLMAVFMALLALWCEVYRGIL